MLPHRSEVTALEVLRCREKLGRCVVREVRKRCRRDQFRSSRNVRRCVFHHEVKMAALIDVVKKGESSGKNQHPDRGEKTEADHAPKFIRTRWARRWTTSHSLEIWLSAQKN